MWIATNGCDARFHEIKRVDGKWACVHSDGSECKESEYDVSDLAA
jgi:hypothetical protein